MKISMKIVSNNKKKSQQLQSYDICLCYSSYSLKELLQKVITLKFSCLFPIEYFLALVMMFPLYVFFPATLT